MIKRTLKETLELVSNLLETAGVEHILIGGIAIGLRGYPRSTIDIDYLVKLEDIPSAKATLEANGFKCEVETEETLHFSGPGAIDFLIAKRPHALKMLNNATKLDNVRSKVAQPEDIIGLKIQAYCNDPRRKWKDQADIAELIKANPTIDWSKLMEYAKIFNQEQFLQEVKSQIEK